MTYEEYKNKTLLKFAQGYKKIYKEIKPSSEINKSLLLTHDLLDKHEKCWGANKSNLSVIKTDGSGQEMIYCTHCFSIVASHSLLKEEKEIEYA